MRKKLKKVDMCFYIYVTYCVVLQKLTQHCKSIQTPINIYKLDIAEESVYLKKYLRELDFNTEEEMKM